MKQTLYIKPLHIKELLNNPDINIKITNTESDYLFKDIDIYLKNLIKTQYLYDLASYSLSKSKGKRVYSFNISVPYPYLVDNKMRKVEIDTEDFANNISYEELQELYRNLKEKLAILKGRLYGEFTTKFYKNRISRSTDLTTMPTNPVLALINKISFKISESPSLFDNKIKRSEDVQESKEKSWGKNFLAKWGFEIDSGDNYYSFTKSKKMSYENTVEFLEDYKYQEARKRLLKGEDVNDVDDPASRPPKSDLISGINFAKTSQFQRAKLTEPSEDGRKIYIGEMMMYPQKGDEKVDENGNYTSKYGEVFSVGGVPLSTKLGTSIYFDRIDFTRTILVLGGTGSGKTEWSKTLLSNSFRKIIITNVFLEVIKDGDVIEIEVDESILQKTFKEDEITVIKDFIDYREPGAYTAKYNEYTINVDYDYDNDKESQTGKLYKPRFRTEYKESEEEPVENISNRMVIHDLKGDYLQYYYRDGKDIIFNVADARGTPWNMWRDFERNPGLINTFAKSIVLSAAGEDAKSNEWVAFATGQVTRSLISAHYYDYPENLSTKEVEKAKWLRFMKLLEEYRDSGTENDDSTARGTWANMQNPFDILIEITYQVVYEDRRTFSIDDFLNTKDIRLLLLNNPSLKEKLTPIFASFLACLIGEAMAGPDTTNFTTLLLDEALSLVTGIDPAVIASLLQAGRSKGMATIMMGQFMRTDEKNKAMLQDISSSRYALITFGVNDNETLNIVSDTYGDIKFAYEKIETVYSENVQRNSSDDNNASANTSGFNYQQSTEITEEKLVPTAELSRIPKFHSILHMPKESLITLMYTPSVYTPIINKAYIKSDAIAFNKFYMSTTYGECYEEYIQSKKFDVDVDNEGTEEEGEDAPMSSNFSKQRKRQKRDIEEQNRVAQESYDELNIGIDEAFGTHSKEELIQLANEEENN